MRKWNLYIKVFSNKNNIRESQFEPKARIWNNECSGREGLVEERPLVWSSLVSWQHWPLLAGQRRGLRTLCGRFPAPPWKRSCWKERLNPPELTVGFPAINRIRYIHFISRLLFSGAICFPLCGLDSYVHQHPALTLRKTLARNPSQTEDHQCRWARLSLCCSSGRLRPPFGREHPALACPGTLTSVLPLLPQTKHWNIEALMQLLAKEHLM